MSVASPITTTAVVTERPMSKLVTNISANVNVIEIKPMKAEQGGGSSGAITKEDMSQFSEELSVLDSNLTLDPALSDLAIQVPYSSSN